MLSDDCDEQTTTTHMLQHPNLHLSEFKAFQLNHHTQYNKQHHTQYPTTSHTPSQTTKSLKHNHTHHRPYNHASGATFKLFQLVGKISKIKILILDRIRNKLALSNYLVDGIKD